MAKTKEEKQTPSEEVRKWLGEIASAKKRDEIFYKDGEEVIDIYSGKKADQIPFNILFSNTETLMPALFSQTPTPVVQRRFKDADPLGLAAAQAATRLLEFSCDTNIDGYETFEQSMRYATLDGLLPGRGITRVKYDADVIDPKEGSSAVSSLQSELVCTDSVKWDRVYFGFARKWSKIPWIAYEEYIDETEATALFGEEIASKINYTRGEEEDDQKDRNGQGTGGREEAENDIGERKTALIYQIWDKDGGRKVLYVSPAYADGVLKREDDPYGITGFYNCPRPVQFIEKSNDLTPVAIYKVYENQAKELNRITLRLNSIFEAIKVRGLVDGALAAELEKVFKGNDNELVPTNDSARLATEGGIDKAIWLVPTDKLIIVATNLIQARESCKQVIYEITGISDILRGQSAASETLGAQKIKEGWGTMRMKRLQKEVQRYCRDTLRIMLDIASQKFTVKSWAQMTGLPYVTQKQHDDAQKMIQKYQQMAQEVQQQAQQTQASGQQVPPQQPPPPPDPQIIQALQAPIWEDVLKLLKNDKQRSCQVDIETDSTIDAQATEEKQNVTEFLTAVGQFMGQVAPAMQSGGMPFEAVKAMLLEVSRRYRFGDEVEEQLKSMQAPQPQPDHTLATAQLKAQSDQQSQQAQIQADAQLEQAKMQMTMQIENAKHQREMEALQAKAGTEMAKMDADKNSQLVEIEAERKSKQAELQSHRDTEKFKAMIAQDTELKKAELQSATALEIARINATKDSAENIQPNAGNQVNELIKQLTTMIETMSAPKIVQRDVNGRVTGIISQVPKTTSEVS